MTEVTLQKYNKINTINKEYEERAKELRKTEGMEKIVKLMDDTLAGKYFAVRQPNKELFGFNYFIDKSKSVDWNDEQREIKNKERKEFNEKQSTIVEDTHEEFKKELINIISEQFKITEKEATVTVNSADSRELRLGDRTQVGVIFRAIDLIYFLSDYIAD